MRNRDDLLADDGAAADGAVGLSATNRIEALCDGVFAIIMTLLVFDIRLPDSPPDQLLALLEAIWPSFLGYCVSFLLLGVYWMGHRAQFQFIRYADANLQWLNFFFFALAGLVPFSEGVLAQYYDQWLAVALYGLNLILIGVMLYFHWLYAVRHPQLVSDEVTPQVVRFGVVRCLFAPACYVVAIALGLINPLISIIAYATVPFLYIIPPLQRTWMHLAKLPRE